MHAVPHVFMAPITTTAYRFPITAATAITTTEVDNTWLPKSCRPGGMGDLRGAQDMLGLAVCVAGFALEVRRWVHRSRA